MPYQKAYNQLNSGNVLILDGGIGTELQRRGVTMLLDAWAGPASLDNFEMLVQIHKDYILAGADIITTNTFSSNRVLLEEAGYANQFDDINKASIAAAFKARQELGRDDVLVAGSVSHMCPIVKGTTTTDLNRLPSKDRMSDAFNELAELHRSEGCDFILLEMMYCRKRMPLAFAAAKATNLPFWAGFSARTGGDGEGVLSFDQNRESPLKDIFSILESFDVDVAGIMHTSPNITAKAIDVLKEFYSGPMSAYPDSEYHKMPEWQFENVISPEKLLEFAEQWEMQGAQVVGGCCGLSPDHIRQLAKLKKT